MIHMYETSQHPEPYMVGGRVCRGRIGSPNIWGPSLSGAEFVRGRDVLESGRVLDETRGAAGSSLIGVTALLDLSKTHLSYIA